MSFLDRKPEHFRRGQDTSEVLSATTLNRIVTAVLRQIRGGRNTNVGYFSDRVTIGSEQVEPSLSDVLNYVSPFLVLAELPDVLLCTPVALPLAGTPPQWSNFVWSQPQQGNNQQYVYVAKPFDLQQSPWNGQTLTVNGVLTAYSYTGIGQRLANTTTQQITPNYFPGDILLAVRTPTGLLANNQYVIWQDINTSARVWGSSSSFSGCRVSSLGHSLFDSSPVRFPIFSVSSNPADFNFDTGYLSSGGGIVVPAAGYYLVSMSGHLYGGSGPNSGSFGMTVYVNGAFANTADRVLVAFQSTEYLTQCSFIFPLEKDDSINGAWATSNTGVGWTLDCVANVQKVG